MIDIIGAVSFGTTKVPSQHDDGGKSSSLQFATYTDTLQFSGLFFNVSTMPIA